jgi:hypothetical protein
MYSVIINRYDVCKLNLKKFSFCLSWISQLLEGKASSDMKVRALEITKLHVEEGNRFAR